MLAFARRAAALSGRGTLLCRGGIRSASHYVQEDVCILVGKPVARAVEQRAVKQRVTPAIVREMVEEDKARGRAVIAKSK